MIDTYFKHLIVASHNTGKVREIRELLYPFGVSTQSASDLNLPEPEETETTFIGNAILKAKAAALASGKPALSDDSGLAVDALDGDPGIYAARWAELPEFEKRRRAVNSQASGRDFDMAMWHVHERMTQAELKHLAGQDLSGKGGLKTARFICALALVMPDGRSYSYEGKVEGTIIWPPRGERGFGYDPIFQRLGQRQTFAEIDPVEKHANSHRADAFGQFIKVHFPRAAS